MITMTLATRMYCLLLIRKFHEAKEKGAPTVTLWGDGSPLREFMHVNDLAAACVHLLKTYDEKGFVNVGVGEDLSIKDLALLVKKITGYTGELTFDASKPNGTLRKLMDVSRLHALGFKAQISLEEGIKLTYADFKEKIESYTAVA